MDKYSYEEALKASLKYFDGDELAATTFLNKYALKSQSINGETVFYERSPKDMHIRLAKELARIESKYPNPVSEGEIFQSLDHFKRLVPQGGPMSGIGNFLSTQSLSNCFVVGTEFDSYGAIFQTDQELVQLMKRRGGVGTDLSSLRPEGTKVSNAAKSSSGVVSFMDRFSNSTREVSQNGRRGALMLSISVKHPDSGKFVDSKLDTTKITGANISIKLSDKFMEAVKKDEVFVQTFPIDEEFEHISNPDTSYTLNTLYEGTKPGTYFRIIKAKELWNKIVANAWKSAEPGILFWDTILRESPADGYAEYGYRTKSTNPCAELPLCPYDSCRLLAINLYSYVINPFTETAYFDFKLFERDVKLGQRLMDDIVDLELEIIDKIIAKIQLDPESIEVKKTELELWNKIKNITSKGRRTGLGVTAEGDMLAALGLKYASKDAINFSEKVHRYFAKSSYNSSIELAKERGAFSVWHFENDMQSDFCRRLFDHMSIDEQNAWMTYGRRNIANLTLAPCGTVSLMTQTTSGVEPAFLIAYMRRRKTGDASKAVFTDATGDMFEEYLVTHKPFVDWYAVSRGGLDFNTAFDELKSKSQDEITKLITTSPYHQSTSNDINWVEKVKMQGAIQRWIDHSISCTVNVPNNTTVEMTNKIYMTAWEAGCKGCTIYRDGSRDGVLVSTSKKSKDKVKSERPESIDGIAVRFKNKYEKWIAFIGLMDDKPWEVFTGRVSDFDNTPDDMVRGKIKKKPIFIDGEKHHTYDFIYQVDGKEVITTNIGDALVPEYYNYARTISMMLQEEVKLDKIVAVLQKLQCGETLNTWNKAVARALKKYIADGTETSQKCPHCGATLIYYNGCTTCPGCGQGGKCD